ncbi:hypothetical protein DPMN_159491 [Dreissena polymorpha]|uniref:Uncharacterized protein n=1 Tax=Dreissena polymorpha TaxID=45954 RepID=A0A9D4EPD6_DREPO|nr:hypothetical protein DPMN_159491 [Dreissena polymorpha]
MGKFQLQVAKMGQTCSSVLETGADRGSYGWNNQHIDRFTPLPVKIRMMVAVSKCRFRSFLSPITAI